MPLFGPPDVNRLLRNRDLKGLIKALSYKKGSMEYDDRYIRVRAAEVLGLYEEEAVAPLIGALQDGDDGVRKAAAKSLKMIGAPSVASLLLILKTGNGPRATAAEVLGEIKAEEAVDPLIVALQQSDSMDIRSAVVRALGQIGDVRAVQPLLAAIRAERDEIQAADRRNTSLGMLKQVLWSVVDRKTYGDALERIGAPGVEPLMAALNDPSAVVREVAATAVGQIGDKRAVEPLIAALKDEDPAVLQAVAVALGKLKDGRAVDPLLVTLKAQEPTVRASAAWALGKIEDRRAVEPLIAALDDQDLQARRGIVWALGWIRDGRAVEPLIAALKEARPDTREAIVEALGNLRDKRAVGPLMGEIEKYKSAWDSRHDTLMQMLKGTTEAATEALRKITGQSFSGAFSWLDWWKKQSK